MNDRRFTVTADSGATIALTGTVRGASLAELDAQARERAVRFFAVPASCIFVDLGDVAEREDVEVVVNTDADGFRKVVDAYPGSGTRYRADYRAHIAHEWRRVTKGGTRRVECVACHKTRPR